MGAATVKPIPTPEKSVAANHDDIRFNLEWEIHAHSVGGTPNARCATIFFCIYWSGGRLGPSWTPGPVMTSWIKPDLLRFSKTGSQKNLVASNLAACSHTPISRKYSGRYLRSAINPARKQARWCQVESSDTGTRRSKRKNLPQNMRSKMRTCAPAEAGMFIVRSDACFIVDNPCKK